MKEIWKMICHSLLSAFFCVIFWPLCHSRKYGGHSKLTWNYVKTNENDGFVRYFFLKLNFFCTFINFITAHFKKTTIHYKASHLASMSESSISKQIAHSCNKKKYILEISQTMIKVGIFHIFSKNLPSVKYHDHDFDHIYQENHQYNVPKWSKELLLETIHVLKSHCHEVCHPNHTISK